MRSKFSRPMLFLRPLHYSAQVSRPAEGVCAAGAHTDYGMLTLLATDGVPGLQILKNRMWLDVPSLPGALIVNLGDMLERCAFLRCDAPCMWHAMRIA
jgi:isopenicillin N synthase-like dioxygenase